MKKLLLIGGGHAHVYILKALQKENPGFEVTMISPSEHQYYSGMFSGYTEGIYPASEITINLEELSIKAGASFIKGKVAEVDPVKKEVVLDECGYPFDLISFDVGSRVKQIPEPTEKVYSVKPNYVFTENIDELKGSPAPVVVGGGAAGVELSLSMLAWRKNHQPHQRVTLIDSGNLLEEFGSKTSRRTEKLARRKGLSIITGERVEGIEREFLRTDSGRHVHHSGVLWLSGAEAPPLFEQSNLKVDAKGFLFVDKYLKNPEYPYIYGAGDCVTIEEEEVPKNGVFAIKEAPVLWENLKRHAGNEELLAFRPPKKYMAILSTGNRQGLLTYGNVMIHGKWCFTLKHFIDSRFMKKYNT
ncbi:hypothetical protein AAV35_008675 [Salimicrobium jeotgali]|uniref:Pyridine nucleotide-disulfide oxidoreductase family protein n=1 Tax=Salimicrobium jeotgali TaxID=1230341 RepID=K2G8U8_9BACI|nr:FAD-dependent oxidoreductase [Salimicrobium jeotgali]AKG04870.1 hypothetical protein AAV35_008675 [Salimicrobium jeotgali]EKE31533.1 pyridine nucleotide-disulfide oxidoreductase family protein [Salimicrobium jeotgali]MBM7696351.1 NADH dehydrogenase FAD-containing subunit [Salimicrobium jeotgali]